MGCSFTAVSNTCILCQITWSMLTGLSIEPPFVLVHQNHLWSSNSVELRAGQGGVKGWREIPVGPIMAAVSGCHPAPRTIQENQDTFLNKRLQTRGRLGDLFLRILASLIKREMFRYTDENPSPRYEGRRPLDLPGLVRQSLLDYKA